MRRPYGLAVAALLALPAAVQADVTGVVTGTSAKIEFLPGFAPNPSGVTDFAGTEIDETRADPNAFGGAAVAARSRVDAKSIAFRNGGAVAGPYTRTTTSTSVDISFVNDGSTAVRPQLLSTILPAGFGIYVGDAGGSCAPASVTECAETTRGLTFAGFVPSVGGLYPDALAGASFGFQILSDGVEIYSLKGSVTLRHDAVSDTNFLTQDLSASASLSGFGVVSPAGSDQWIGYAWDPTALALTFPTILGVGESRTMTYVTTTSAFSSAVAPGNSSSPLLIGYSAFGDPVGRGGTIGRIVFSPLAFALPSFSFARLSFLAEPSPPAAVPEPSTWLLLIAGFGLVGRALRARRADRLA